MDSIFIFNLEKNEIVTTQDNLFPAIYYRVTYYNTDDGVFVEIGDFFRHNINLKDVHWNRILRIIRDNELDKDGIDAIVYGLLRTGLHEEYVGTFLSAIRNGTIKETSFYELKNKKD